MASAEQGVRTGAAFPGKAGRKITLIEALQALLALFGAVVLIMGLRFGSFERAGGYVDQGLHGVKTYVVGLYDSARQVLFSSTGGAIKKAGDATRKTGRDIEKLGH